MVDLEAIKIALDEAIKDLIAEASDSDMMPWEIHRVCKNLKGLNACIKTLQWVLELEVKDAT